jgi:uncharacterized protein YbjT (DUF2867 family)
MMIAVTGITGKVGGQVARRLDAQGKKIRAVVRDAQRAAAWADAGHEVCEAAFDDADALTAAFRGADGVFLMTPPNFDPEPGFPDTRRAAKAIKAALELARPGRVVFLSTVGAHVDEPNLLSNSKITEEMLRTVSIPVAFLRAAWFMENASWDADAARAGLIASFLQPLDHPIPMVATRDIAEVAAELLQQTWTGTRVIELEGPRRYSAADIASGFEKALNRVVQTELVPRDQWEQIFRSQGMKNPEPRIRMLDGFNEGWIDFERNGAETRKGSTELAEVLQDLLIG